MASYTPWLNENGALVDETNTANSPSKDFYHIFLTPSQCIYRVWKIVPPIRPNCYPAPIEIRDSWEDFKHDERLHSELHRVSGENIIAYLMNIVEGHLDYLTRLPRNVLFRIILMLDLESIARLSMTNKLFKELCFDNDLWKKIYKMHNKQPITQELMNVVDIKGWREVFFTNKLQLQMQMRRLAQTGGNTAFLTEQNEGMHQ